MEMSLLLTHKSHFFLYFWFWQVGNYAARFGLQVGCQLNNRIIRQVWNKALLFCICKLTTNLQNCDENFFLLAIFCVKAAVLVSS